MYSRVLLIRVIQILLVSLVSLRSLTSFLFLFPFVCVFVDMGSRLAG